ncbi:unnamed protein product, partial [Mesorhabditis spiculigera]
MAPPRKKRPSDATTTPNRRQKASASAQKPAHEVIWFKDLLPQLKVNPPVDYVLPEEFKKFKPHPPMDYILPEEFKKPGPVLLEFTLGPAPSAVAVKKGARSGKRAAASTEAAEPVFKTPRLGTKKKKKRIQESREKASTEGPSIGPGLLEDEENAEDASGMSVGELLIGCVPSLEIVQVGQLPPPDVLEMHKVKQEVDMDVYDVPEMLELKQEVDMDVCDMPAMIEVKQEVDVDVYDVPVWFSGTVSQEVEVADASEDSYVDFYNLALDVLTDPASSPQPINADNNNTVLPWVLLCYRALHKAAYNQKLKAWMSRSIISATRVTLSGCTGDFKVESDETVAGRKRASKVRRHSISEESTKIDQKVSLSNLRVTDPHTRMRMEREKAAQKRQKQIRRHVDFGTKKNAKASKHPDSKTSVDIKPHIHHHTETPDRKPVDHIMALGKTPLESAYRRTRTYMHNTPDPLPFEEKPHITHDSGDTQKATKVMKSTSHHGSTPLVDRSVDSPEITTERSTSNESFHHSDRSVLYSPSCPTPPDKCRSSTSLQEACSSVATTRPRVAISEHQLNGMVKKAKSKRPDPSESPLEYANYRLKRMGEAVVAIDEVIEQLHAMDEADF